MNDKAVPAALRDAIKACDNNQSELARRLGIADRQLVHNWVTRKRIPNFWYPAVLEMARSYREGK